MGFAVPPGFAASLQTRPRQLMSTQLGWITVADRLSLRGPSGLSVSCSREIFTEAQVGAPTVPRSLAPGRFGYSALSRQFTISVDHQRTSVQRTPDPRSSTLPYERLLYLTVAPKTSSISKSVEQPVEAIWLSRLSVQMGCETPPNDANPS